MNVLTAPRASMGVIVFTAGLWSGCAGPTKIPEGSSMERDRQDPLEATLTQGLTSFLSAIGDPPIVLDGELAEELEAELAPPPDWQSVGIPASRRPRFPPAQFRWSLYRVELTLSCPPSTKEPRPPIAPRTIVLGRRRVPESNMHLPLDQPSYDLRTVAETLRAIVRRNEVAFRAVARFHIHHPGNPNVVEIFEPPAR